MMSRDYHAMAEKAKSLAGRNVPREDKLSTLTEILWDGLCHGGVSWCGFYLPSADNNALLLACCKPKPACSPIGLHGVCGKAYLSKAPVVVADVKQLGESYVACDPRDSSEVVVPLLDSNGSCWAVLDFDSHETNAFTRDDAEGLAGVLFAAGLSVPATSANHEKRPLAGR